MPHRNPHKKKEFRVDCPKCGEFGYWGFGWTRNKHRRHRQDYQVNYIRHYGSEVYRKQMIRYRNHEIKSRPNGQARCYIPRADLEPVNNGEYYRLCCHLGYGKHRYEALHKFP